MAYRLTFALVASGLVFFAASDRAHARLRAGIDANTTLPLGVTERIADPALTGRLKLHWIFPNERLAVGLVGGHAKQPYRQDTDPTVSATLVGGEVIWTLAPKDWGTRPYLSFQLGFASLGAKGDVEFDAPSRRKSASGMFVIPEVGLLVQIVKNFGLQFNFHYQHIMSFSEIAVAQYRTHAAQSMGVGGGIIVMFM
jgi:hypothetical protein